MEEQTFKFSSYDCIGFDLDNTVAKFKIGAMVELEYKLLSQFLIKKGYSEKHLDVDIDYDFMQKGLILDGEKGNILKIADDGRILRATHGTKPLSKKEIENVYTNSHWELTDLFINDPLAVWNGPNSEKMRCLLDYFDIVVSLVFARCVDSVDEERNGIQEMYSIYEDLYEGLLDMFSVDHFQTNQGGYYSEMKNNPEKYYHKRSEKFINWLKSLKKEGKLLFLITGSNIDFASCTASNTLGTDWKSYFDIVITFAKKPGFFTMNREFIGLEGINQTGHVKPEDVKLGEIYVFGNWQDLHKCLVKNSSNPNPKFLYVGDNAIQDNYAPNTYSHCDTVAICEELYIDNKFGTHPDEKLLISQFWGSYFKDQNVSTIWNKIIKENSKLCLPDLECAAKML